MEYYETATIKLIGAKTAEITSAYSQGFVFGRKEKGLLHQTRSLRIDLKRFELNSENRRVLRKLDEIIDVSPSSLPLKIENYDWMVHKTAKDFYTSKFPDIDFSASKIKEIVTTEHNFNHIFNFSEGNETLGYAICYVNKEILHYCYPFYNLAKSPSNLGMYMMLSAVMHAKKENRQYCYLGSVTKLADKYKLQFNGLEWWTGTGWSTDLLELKQKIS